MLTNKECNTALNVKISFGYESWFKDDLTTLTLSQTANYIISCQLPQNANKSNLGKQQTVLIENNVSISGYMADFAHMTS